jgi:hypothetical protein
MDLDRVDAGAGVLGAVLGFVGSSLVFSTLPREDDPVEKYLSFVVDKRGQILAGVVMFAISTGLLLWWANALRHRLATAGDRALPDLVLAAAVLALGCTFVGLMPVAALAWRGPAGLDGNVVRLLVDMLSVLFAVLSAVPFFLLAFAASLSMLRTRLFPAWAAWLGMVAAVVNGIFVFSLFAKKGLLSPYSPVGFLGAVLFFVWVAASGVLMLQGDERVAAVGASTAQPAVP